MNWNIELTLDTDIQRFEAWLDQSPLRTLPFNVNLEDGKFLLVSGAPTRERGGFRVYEIIARLAKPSSTDPKMLEAISDFPVIFIELFEPAINRLIVKVECKHPALVAYYLDLLEAIVKLYPETRKTVLDYLSELHPNDKLKSEQLATVDPRTGAGQQVSKKTRGVNDDTSIKLEKLRAYRLQELARTKQIPKLPIACQSIEPTISEKTVKKRDPELYKNWKVKEYR